MILSYSENVNIIKTTNHPNFKFRICTLNCDLKMHDFWVTLPTYTQKIKRKVSSKWSCQQSWKNFPVNPHEKALLCFASGTETKSLKRIRLKHYYMFLRSDLTTKKLELEREKNATPHVTCTITKLTNFSFACSSADWKCNFKVNNYWRTTKTWWWWCN